MMMNGAMKVELLEHVLSPEVFPNIKGYIVRFQMLFRYSKKKIYFSLICVH